MGDGAGKSTLALARDALPAGAQAGGRVCPKCSYARRTGDDAPAWQCPRCGVAYDKVIGSPAVAQRASDRADRALRLERSKRPSGPLPLAILALALGAVGWWGYGQWRAAHPSAAQRAAQAQAQGRLAEVAAASGELAVATDLKTAEEHLRMARPKQGMELLERRAAEGHPEAMTALAVAYQGYGHATADLAKSREWMERAAREGSLSAYLHLGYASETGKLGAPQNYEQAANHYRTAARQGYGPALYALGLLYARSVPGTANDPVATHVLFDLAHRAYEKSPVQGEFGVNDKSPHSARYEMSQLEKTMSPVDIVKARELADAWSPGQPFPFH